MRMSDVAAGVDRGRKETGLTAAGYNADVAAGGAALGAGGYNAIWELHGFAGGYGNQRDKMLYSLAEPRPV